MEIVGAAATEHITELSSGGGGGSSAVADRDFAVAGRNGESGTNGEEALLND